MLFDLTDALFGKIARIADFFQRHRAGAVQPVAQRQHFRFVRFQRVQHFSDIALHRIRNRFFVGIVVALVFDKIAHGRAVVVARSDLSVEGNHIAGNVHHFAHVLLVHLQHARNFGEFLFFGFIARHKLSRVFDLNEFVRAVERQPNGAALFADRF